MPVCMHVDTYLLSVSVIYSGDSSYYSERCAQRHSVLQVLLAVCPYYISEEGAPLAVGLDAKLNRASS